MSNQPPSVKLENPPISDRSMQELYSEYAPQGFRYAMSMTRNSADSDEIVQEAFCRLVQAQTTKKLTSEPHGSNDENETSQRDSFPALFFTAIRNLCIDLLRKRKTRGSQIPLESAPEPEAAHDKNEQEQIAKADQLQTAIRELILQLPDQWADAMRLKINGELTYEQIANVLDATHAQVRTWIFRARKQLQKDLQQIGWLD